MVIKWSLTIPELSGEEERRAYVYLPRVCQENPDFRAPVLYMFDGHNLFYDEDATYGKSWGLADYLDASDTPLIVAAVECTHDPNNGRLSEYSPFTFSDLKYGRVPGRGRQTMEWFVGYFKPLIDREFPTLPHRKHTFIGGSSMGGLMSLYALLEYNKVFSRAAALSPSLWASPAKLERLATRARIHPGSVLYMDYGQRELKNHRGMDALLTRMAELMMNRRVLLNFRIVPGGNHSEASWEKQNPFFVETLMYGVDL